MKKILYIMLIMAIIAPTYTHADTKLKVFYKATQEVVGKDKEDNDVKGYKLKKSEKILSSTIKIKSVGKDDYILTSTTSDADAIAAKDQDEFLGYGYIDALVRISLGISKATISDIENMIGAHWKIKDEWYFGSITDWKKAGSPETVWFSRLRDIFGVNLH